MQLLPADYVLCGLTLGLAILGLFRGLSGTLAFLLATVAAALVGMFGWSYSASLTSVMWIRGGGTLTSLLLAFGIVRLVVRKLVGGLLAQPSDAIFGFLIGVGVGILLLLAWAHSGFYLDYSNLARAVADYVR